jgi:5-methylcytosine-specific restriction endonuclease McrA
LEHHQAVARRRYHVNPEKSRADRKAQYHKDREWGALRAQLGNYGLTLDQYHAMQERQEFACAICGDVADMHIDHCHTTDKIRGLLCAGCNLGIGHFRERPAALVAAAVYVAA